MKRPTGPPPQPSNVRALHGEAGKRRKKAPEPQPEAGSTIAPAWLDALAREHWNELSVELSRLGLLGKIDRGVLAGACWWYAKFRKAAGHVHRRGLTEKTPNNGRQASPDFKIARDAWREYTTAVAAFGVTPSARTRLVAAGQHDDDDDFEKLLQQREHTGQPA